MAERSLYDTGWLPLDPTQRMSVIKIIADHHKIVKVDLLLKTDQDSSFPTSEPVYVTYTRDASADLSLTYFVDGYVWNFEDLKDAQWYRLIFYGVIADEPTNYIHNISVKTVAKAPRI